MTTDELWLYAVERALEQFAGHQNRRLVERLLDEAGGNVSIALTLMTRRESEFAEPASFYLGNFGHCGPECRVECLGYAGSHPIRAWAGPDHWGRPPDLVITWREVFEYVQGRRPNDRLVWDPEVR